MLSLFKTKSSLYIEQIRLFFQPLFVYQVEGELYLKVNRKEIKKLLFFLRYHLFAISYTNLI